MNNQSSPVPWATRMLGDTPMPQHEPHIPDGIIEESLAVLSGVPMQHMPWIEDNQCHLA